MLKIALKLKNDMPMSIVNVWDQLLDITLKPIKNSIFCFALCIENSNVDIAIYLSSKYYILSLFLCFKTKINFEILHNKIYFVKYVNKFGGKFFCSLIVVFVSSLRIQSK